MGAAVQGYIEPVLLHPPEMMPGADVAVARLAALGVPLGIVSNTGRTPGVVLRRVLERYGMLRHFHALSYSDEVGVRKPASEIFARTLTGLGVAPPRALHVGDNPEADIQGARSLGMRTAHYAFDGRAPSPDADLVVTHLAELPDRLADLLAPPGA
jgi:putative hydrolase of the HAD superfamily